MTDAAILACCHMGRVGLGVLTGCINTIVAGITPSAQNFGSVVVYERSGEIYRVMTHRTIGACIAMNCRIRRPSGPNRNMIHNPVMTRGTITGDTRVSKNRWCE
jgi:hypothetical protein